jgi:two-component system, LytTR family, sensor kinase
MTNAIGHWFLAVSSLWLTFIAMNAAKRLTPTLTTNRWLREIGLFLAFFVLNTFNSWQFVNSWVSLGREVLYFSLLYAYALLQRFWLLPLLLDTAPEPRRYALLTALTLLPYTYLVMRVDGWLYADEYLKNPPHGPLYLFNFGCLVAGALLFNVPELARRFYHQRQQQDEYRILRQQMELSTLRSQLNPHFLFNTLNNLYGLSLRYPHRAPDLILQLAGLMRYQLDTADKAAVPLTAELAALADYIGLETERVGSRCTVYTSGFDVPIPNDLLIAPMLLLPFVENAFKHGTAGAEPCTVSVQVCIEAGQVRLRVEDSIPSRAKATVSTGVGLANTRQRLLMLYPDCHDLTITQMPQEWYLVELTLYLAHQPTYV